MSADLPLPDTIQTILGTLAWWSERTPEAPALQTLERAPMTYRELHLRVGMGIDRLQEVGITRGDRVALALPDDPEAIVTLLAVLGIATAVPLNPWLQTADLASDLRRLDARALVLGEHVPNTAFTAADEVGLPIMRADRLSGTTVPLRQEARASPAAKDAVADDVMLIARTSGATSLPKLAPITHRMQLAAARARNRQRGITAADAGLLLAPGFSVMFLTNFVTMLVAGGCTMVVPRLEPALCLRANAELQPTWMLAGPALYSAIVQEVLRHGELVRNPRLRLANWGGAGADTGLVRRIEEAFGVPSDSNYGMTEASAIATPGLPGTAKPGSVGLAAAGEIRVVDESGRALEGGETGEIIVRGPHVFSGYLGDPDATADAFTDDGWFRTGDLGYLDADGHLFLTGRVNEQINRGGVKIMLSDVDDVLLGHPAVGQAAIFGVGDVRLGQDIVAAIVLKPGKAASPRELRSWMLDRLMPFKIPRRIWFLGDLPRTPTGKVQRGELARAWGARRE